MHDVEVGHSAVALLLPGLVLHLFQGDPLGEGVNAQDLSGLQRQGKRKRGENSTAGSGRRGSRAEGTPGLESYEGLCSLVWDSQPCSHLVSTQRGTAPVRRGLWGVTKIRWVLCGQRGRNATRSVLSFLLHSPPFLVSRLFFKTDQKAPRSLCHPGTYRP